MGYFVKTFDHRPRYVEVWERDVGSPNDDDLVEISQWVQQNELGYRESYNGWKLRNSAAVTMFLLRWNLD